MDNNHEEEKQEHLNHVLESSFVDENENLILAEGGEDYRQDFDGKFGLYFSDDFRKDYFATPFQDGNSTLIINQCVYDLYATNDDGDMTAWTASSGMNGPALIEKNGVFSEASEEDTFAWRCNDAEFKAFIKNGDWDTEEIVPNAHIAGGCLHVDGS